MDAIGKRILNVAAALRELRQQGWERYRQCFGVERHRFHQMSPVPEKEVSAFESRHGIQLPDDYRVFLTRVGNGGAGPYCGILAIESWDEAADADRGTLPRDYLAKPSPLHPAIVRDAEWMKRTGCTRETRYQGAIAVAHQGCTYYCLLVVSGEARGRVCYVDQEDQPPFFVNDTSFLDWYERWLAELRAGLDMDWFGFSPGGSDEEVLRILREDADPRRRATSAHEIGRRAQLRDDLRDALCVALRDRHEDVRTAAAHALRKGGRQAAGPLSEALRDPAAAVRRAAAYAAKEAAGQEIARDLREALRNEPDPDAFLALAGTLGGLEPLDLEILATRLHHADPMMRSHAAYFLGQTQRASAGEILLHRLADPDPQVRLSVVQAIATLKHRPAVEALRARGSSEPDELVCRSIEQAIDRLNRE